MSAVGDARKRADDPAEAAFNRFGISGKGIGSYESDRLAFMAGWQAAQDALAQSDDCGVFACTDPDCEHER